MLITNYNSPFLGLQSSFWPIFIGFSLLSVTGRFVIYFHFKISLVSFLISLLFLILISFSWWKDVVREGLLGYHTSKLELSFRFGMILFILSEVFFFVSFFWAYYDASLAPCVELGMQWPPKGILPLGVYSVPLLNTVILLSSGVTITWSHHALVNNNFTSSFIGLIVTVCLGVYFLYMQYLEYSERAFSISDGIYGTTFFIRTGFHGMHVIVGTTFLFYVLVRMTKGVLLHNHHFMFEAAAWYWHFVDVVWLFLYISVYWWGSL